MITVGGHGNPSMMVDACGRALTAKELGKMVREHSKYKPGQTVKLMSCNTGKGGKPYAQKLATELGCPVVAPDEFLWIWPDGKYMPTGMKPDGTMDTSVAGSWRVFNP